MQALSLWPVLLVNLENRSGLCSTKEYYVLDICVFKVVEW